MGRDDPAMIECEQGQHITVCTTVQTVHSLILITAPTAMIGGAQFRPAPQHIVPGHWNQALPSQNKGLASFFWSRTTSYLSWEN